MRTHDLALVNEFINDPEIFPHLGFETESFDAVDQIDDPDFAFITNGDDAMMMFNRTGPEFLGIWEMHSLFRKRCPNKRELALEFMKELGARLIWTQAPAYHAKAIRFCEALEMTPHGLFTDDVVGEVYHYSLEIEPCQ
jgi:hypothetical protein